MSEKTRALLSSALTASLAAIIVVGLALGSDEPTDRVAHLGDRIRCPVCTGESISDSPSETARAMMMIVAEHVSQGRSDAEIIAFFQARYGEGILLDPPFRGGTLLLWILPAVALVVGAVLIAGRLRTTPVNKT